jgi:steroid 5-alpha reductase family enzyme
LPLPIAKRNSQSDHPSVCTGQKWGDEPIPLRHDCSSNRYAAALNHKQGLQMLIRQVFSVFALAMLGAMVVRLYAGVWTDLNWLMLGAACLACLLVFRCFVYVFNASYALACVINGALIMLMLPSVVSFLLGGLMVLYGVRLGAFTWTRINSKSYAPRSAKTRGEDKKMHVAIKVALWVQCSLLYTFHLFGIYIVAEQAALTSSVLFSSAIILLGIVMEGLADSQKQRSKSSNPGEHISTGLFTRWRHPNYMGEILVQTGLIVAGVGAVASGWVTYLAVCVAPAYIILLMISESFRADQALQDQYANIDGFAEYWQRSGSLLPKF